MLLVEQAKKTEFPTLIHKTRSAVIISGTAFNQRSKVTVLPITSAVPVDVIVNPVLFEEEDTELVDLWSWHI